MELIRQTPEIVKNPPEADIKIVNWGLIEYQEAVERQLDCVEKVASGESPELIVVCTHPAVVTLGRFKGGGDLMTWNGPVIESSRGGRATYHGPNQVVIYPIIDLRPEDRLTLKSRDVGQYLRLLSEAVAETLREFGVKAEARQGTDVDEAGEKRQLTGVWLGNRKVASLGVAVKRWVTYHGVAVNLDYDPNAFRGIRPCGFAPGTMISVEEILGTRVSREAFSRALVERIISFCR